MIVLFVIAFAIGGTALFYFGMGALFKLLDDKCTDAVQRNDGDGMNRWCE